MPTPTPLSTLSDKTREITFPQTSPLRVTCLKLHFDPKRLQVRIALNLSPGKLKYLFLDSQTSKRYYLEIVHSQLTNADLTPHTHLLLKKVRQHQQGLPYRVFLTTCQEDQLTMVRELDATFTLLTETP